MVEREILCPNPSLDFSIVLFGQPFIVLEESEKGEQKASVFLVKTQRRKKIPKNLGCLCEVCY